MAQCLVRHLSETQINAIIAKHAGATEHIKIEPYDGALHLVFLARDKAGKTHELSRGWCRVIQEIADADSEITLRNAEEAKRQSTNPTAKTAWVDDA